MDAQKKTFKRCVIALLTILVFTACSLSVELNHDIETTTPTFKSSDERGDIFVDIKQLHDFIHFQELSGFKLEAVKTTPIEYKDMVVAYLVEYTQGWEIISSCKRTNPLIAYDYTTTTESISIPPIKDWLFTVYDDIYSISRLSNKEIYQSFAKNSLEEMEKNTLFWDAISSSKANAYTKAHLPNPDDYELINVQVDTVLYDEVEHLMSTHWHQHHPYNQFCPLKSYSTTQRAPAGCVAIAGAQTLYYLHCKTGNPTNAPDSAYVSGNVLNYSMEQYGNSPDPWNDMTNNDGHFASILVAKVGKLVNMDYGNNGSTAYTRNLATSAFPLFGIECSYQPFDSDELSYYLSFGYPAIVRAESEETELSPEGECSHAFIIDGFKRTQIQTTLTYRRKNSTSLFSPLYQEILLDLPSVVDYSMNWGWGEEYDNGFYSTTGDWIVNIGGRDYNLNQSRKMICDFVNPNEI